MKKIIFLSFMAAGLFFTVNTQAQEISASATTTDVTARAANNNTDVINARLAELDNIEAELKASGLTGDALQARLDAIQVKRLQLKGLLNSDSKEAKSVKAATSLKE